MIREKKTCGTCRWKQPTTGSCTRSDSPYCGYQTPDGLWCEEHERRRLFGRLQVTSRNLIEAIDELNKDLTPTSWYRMLDAVAEAHLGLSKLIDNLPESLGSYVMNKELDDDRH